MKISNISFSALLIMAASLFMATAFTNSRDGFRQVNNKEFAIGEHLTYSAHYLGFNGGEAKIKLDEKIHFMNGRPCYKVDVAGRTTGMASWFYHVDDLWRSFIDTSAIMTHKFYRNIEEGKNYKLEETTVFDHRKKRGFLEQKKSSNTKQKEFEIPDHPQDMISGYYFLRTVDYSQLEPGDMIGMNAVYEDSVYDFKVRYLGRETVKTKVGKMHVVALSPIMPQNKLFDGGDAITIYVSDDKNRIPVKIKAKMFIGAVNIELVDYGGLKHEFNFK